MTDQKKPWEHAKTAGSGQDPLATRFVQSLTYDRRLYKSDIVGSVAHARMLRSVGLMTDDELSQIEEGLAEIRSEIESAAGDDGAAWPGWQAHLEDVHMCIEAALIEKIGDAGRKLHTGRSRNDQVALDLLLWIKDALKELGGASNELLAAFIELANRDGRIVMPSYTHLQRAQPIVVGGELMAWVTALDRARERLGSLSSLNLQNPLGSGAIAGSALPIDRDHTAAALGVGPPSLNSIDSTASRDAAVDFVYGLAMTSMTLSRWAEQWIIYASTEFGYIKLDQRYTTGSSMMPQKVNPDMLELIRGRCGGVYGHLVALLTITKGITVGYNRDLQEDKRHVFAAYDTVMDCLKIASGIVRTVCFNQGIIESNLDKGYLDATSLAEYLVSKGVAFRTAHQIVGALVRDCQERSLGRLDALELEDFHHACLQAGLAANIFNKDVYDWLGAVNVAKKYTSAGNAGFTGFEQQLRWWEAKLKNNA